MDLRHDDTSEDPDDSSLYDSTWSLNSSTYDPTYESVFWIDGQGTESPPFTPTPTANVDRLTRRTSLVDGLLAEIYSSRTRKATHRRLTEGDVDLTDCLPESSSVIGATVSSGSGSSDRSYLEQLNVLELRALAERWRLRVDEASAQLLGMLKQRERSKGQIEKNCRVVTAVLRSWASRNNLGRADRQGVKFSLGPKHGGKSFCKWTNAILLMTRHPLGMPDMLRPNVWLSLAGCGLQDVDWQGVMRFAFSEHSNPDDDDLGIQIVKDLHRTGYSGFSGGEDNASRSSLKRVLLAYARWNKDVGYCQGFNVMVALLLQVMDGREEDALKAMIYIIDRVMPPHYFARNLHALLADVEVFHGLMQSRLPNLYTHLSRLRLQENDSTEGKGSSHEPPLINVFTIQWFLTMFAMCLPYDCVLRLWDCILLEGSEIVLRAGLAVWKLLSPRLMPVKSTDEFYSSMEVISREMLEGTAFETNDLLDEIHYMPKLPNLNELRERYTYNISPFPSVSSSISCDDDQIGSVGCLHSFMPHLSLWNFQSVLPKISPFAAETVSLPVTKPSCSHRQQLETLSVSDLQRRYKEVQQHQRHAYVMVQVLSESNTLNSPSRSKPAPTTPLKMRTDVPKNLDTIGIHLVHPAVMKPLPRHKKQPAGHRTPTKSNLFGQPLKPMHPLHPQIECPDKQGNSLELTVSPTGLPGESPDAKPLNHLIDFLPPEQKVCRRLRDGRASKQLKTLASPSRTCEPQNEGLTADLSTRDARRNYGRRSGMLLSPIRERRKFSPLCHSVVSTSPSSASLMSPTSSVDYGGPMLPRKQRGCLRKGISKAIIHSTNSEMHSVNGDAGAVQQEKGIEVTTPEPLGNALHSKPMSGERVNSSCSTTHAITTLQTAGGTDRCSMGLDEISVVRKDRPSRSPPIDLLVTTAEEDSAGRRRADADFRASRPDLLISLASNDIPIHACDQEDVSGVGCEATSGIVPVRDGAAVAGKTTRSRIY